MFGKSENTEIRDWTPQGAGSAAFAAPHFAAISSHLNSETNAFALLILDALRESWAGNSGEFQDDSFARASRRMQQTFSGCFVEAPGRPKETPRSLDVELDRETYQFQLASSSADYFAAIEVAAQRFNEKFAPRENEQFKLAFLDDRLLDRRATRVFTVKKEHEVIATVSMLFQRFPGDLLRTGEADIQGGGIREWIAEQPFGSVLELSMFANKQKKIGKRLFCIRALLALQYLYWKGMNDNERPRYGIITVHPSHVKTYRLMGFKILRDEWKYYGVRPAITMVMDYEDAAAHRQLEKILLSAGMPPQEKPEPVPAAADSVLASLKSFAVMLLSYFSL